MGYSLGLDTVLRCNFKRHSLAENVGGLCLVLFSDLKLNVLVSDVNVSFTSRPTNSVACMSIRLIQILLRACLSDLFNFPNVLYCRNERKLF